MPNDLSQVLNPIETANGLPNHHYTSEDTFMAERDALWFSTWAGICAASELPEKGDAKPIDFLGVPLFVMRGKDDKLRVFQNICRHRGMILVSEPRKIEGAIRCPYHSWCYNHDGKLAATPHVGGPGHNTHPDMNRDDLGLIEVRAHVWMDVVFINLSGDAPAFEDLHADLIARWAEFDGHLHYGGPDSSFTLDCGTNWKLAIENYCESYHLPWVHPGLNAYSRLEDHYHIEEPGYCGQGTLVYRQLTGEDGTVFPDFPNLSAKWDTGGEYITATPNVMLGVQRDHTYCIILEPKGPTRTLEHVHIYYATDDTSDNLRAKNTEQWRGIFIEDIGVVEGMQAGRGAPGFDGGRFSPVMDGPTHHFHRWVATRMTGPA